MINTELAGIGMTSQRTRERLVKRLQEQGIDNQQVLELIRTVPRHLFVDEAMAHRAYEDVALPIGYNQTISQPYIVALMTQLLFADGPKEKVLEIGTGSGYQTAILCRMASSVFSVERIKILQEKARKRLAMLKLRNVSFRYADGGFGWPDNSMRFDGILAAASPAKVPEELLNQLAIGGTLVMPVGDEKQQLRVIKRTETGYQEQAIIDVCFVPLRSGIR